MSKAYLLYLIFIPVASLLLLLAVFLRTRRREKQHRQKVQMPISGGNVSVFFGRDNHVVAIPYVKDKFGVGRAVIEVQFLRAPYKAETLGHMVRYALSLCKNGVPSRPDELMSRLGFNDWKEFSLGKRNISVHYIHGIGVVMNTTRRRRDGAYEFNDAGNERILSAETSDRELGQAILELLPRCR